VGAAGAQLRIKRTSLASRIGLVPATRILGTVRKRYGQEDGDFLAAGIAYYAFLSLFPLVLLAVSVLGFVLASRPVSQAEMIRRISDAVPGLRSVIGPNVRSLIDDRVAVGVAGLLGLAWSGRGIADAASRALGRVHHVAEARSFVERQMWTFGPLAVLGMLAVTATALGALVASVHFGEVPILVTAVLGGMLTFALDTILFLTSYRLLTRRKGPRLRRLMPGAMLAAAGFTALKLAGGWYATRTVTEAQAVYGTFAATVGVLVLLYLAARLFIYGAVLNAVLIDRE
jgi:YihY family inner membrane protein